MISQTQVRSIEQDLLNQLASIKDNSPASQITAALALIRMNVTPVVAIHIPFGGDNHNDTGLASETAQTISGVATIASLQSQLQSQGLQDKVMFVSLNVFGRTLGPGNTDGRQHNANHQVTITIGKGIRGGVVGAVAPVQGDYGATAIDSGSCAGSPGGDIASTDTLGSFGQTLLGAVGVDGPTIARSVLGGKIITGALT